MRNDILERKEEILQWISERRSKAYICKQLLCKPETLNSYLAKMGIEYAGKQDWNKGGSNGQYIPAEEYAKKDRPQASRLLQKLLREGIKEYKCEICGLTEWLGEPIPLELHHKDCNHFNNDLSNLQVICPNCHAKQHGNAGANVGFYKQLLENNTIPSVEPQKKICPICGKKEIWLSSKMCTDCYAESQRITEWPTREELKQLIRTTPFTTIGKQFGVSDNAIRNWCKKYNLPQKVSEIKKYTDEEWFNL